jgi:hypothetical protein
LWRPISILDYGRGENRDPALETLVVAVGNISGWFVIVLWAGLLFRTESDTG